MIKPGTFVDRLCSEVEGVIRPENYFLTVMRAGNPEGRMVQDFFGRTEAPFRLLSNKVITPSDEEQERNPRSRSAKLRIAEKV